MLNKCAYMQSTTPLTDMAALLVGGVWWCQWFLPSLHTAEDVPSVNFWQPFL